MNRIKILIGILILCKGVANGQPFFTNENPFFTHSIYTSMPQKNDVSFPTPGITCITFDPNNVEQWQISHGHPHYDAHGTCDYHCMFMDVGIAGNGHGLYYDYHFEVGQTYTVHVYIFDGAECAPPVASSLIVGSLDLSVVQNASISRDFTQCGNIPPSSGFGVVQNIASFHNSDFLGRQTSITFTATNNFNHLWIRPSRGPSPFFTPASVHLRGVYITRECPEEFETVSGNFITPKPYVAKNLVVDNLGSTYASTDPGGTTMLIAEKSIEFLPSTILNEPDPGQYVLAELVPNLCDSWFPQLGSPQIYKPISSSIDYLTHDLQKPSMATTTVEGSYSPGSTRVFPNPTAGELTVQLLEKTDYSISVCNSIESTVYSTTLHGENKHVIYLDDNLPAGNYVLQITGKELRHVEKITLVR